MLHKPVQFEVSVTETMDMQDAALLAAAEEALSEVPEEGGSLARNATMLDEPTQSVTADHVAASASIDSPAASTTGAKSQSVGSPEGPITVEVSSIFYVRHAITGSGDLKSLSCPKGTLLMVSRKEDNGWWHGHVVDDDKNLTGEAGWFPGSYVKPLTSKILKKLQAKQDAKQTAAIVKIQSVFRGHEARKVYAAMKVGTAGAGELSAEAVPKDAEEEFDAGPVVAEELTAAHRVGDAEVATSPKKVAAIVQLQSFVRGALARQNYKRQHQAATLIQSVFRGLEAKKTIENLRFQNRQETDAAVLIQSQFRGLQARKKLADLQFEKMMAGGYAAEQAQLAQEAADEKEARMAAEILAAEEEETRMAAEILAVEEEETRMAAEILAQEQELMATDKAARKQQAAQTIQNLVRRYFAIQSVNQLKARRHGAVLKIQAGFRGMKARKQADFQRFLRCIDDYDKQRYMRAVVLIQCHVRGHIARKLAAEARFDKIIAADIAEAAIRERAEAVARAQAEEAAALERARQSDAAELAAFRAEAVAKKAAASKMAGAAAATAATAVTKPTPNKAPSGGISITEKLRAKALEKALAGRNLSAKQREALRKRLEAKSLAKMGASKPAAAAATPAASQAPRENIRILAEGTPPPSVVLAQPTYENVPAGGLSAVTSVNQHDGGLGPGEADSQDEEFDFPPMPEVNAVAAAAAATLSSSNAHTTVITMQKQHGEPWGCGFDGPHIGKIMKGSVFSQHPVLYEGMLIISINGEDVSTDGTNLIQLIQQAGNHVELEVQLPDDAGTNPEDDFDISTSFSPPPVFGLRDDMLSPASPSTAAEFPGFGGGSSVVEGHTHAELAQADVDLDAHIEATVAAHEATISGAQRHTHAELAQADADLDAHIEATVAAHDATIPGARRFSKAEIADADADLDAEIEAQIAEAEAELAAISEESVTRRHTEAQILKAGADLDAHIEATIAAHEAEITHASPTSHTYENVVLSASTEPAAPAPAPAAPATATEPEYELPASAVGRHSVLDLQQADTDLDALIEAQIKGHNRDIAIGALLDADKGPMTSPVRSPPAPGPALEFQKLASKPKRKGVAVAASPVTTPKASWADSALAAPKAGWVSPGSRRKMAATDAEAPGTVQSPSTPEPVLEFQKLATNQKRKSVAASASPKAGWVSPTSRRKQIAAKPAEDAVPDWQKKAKARRTSDALAGLVPELTKINLNDESHKKELAQYSPTRRRRESNGGKPAPNPKPDDLQVEASSSAPSDSNAAIVSAIMSQKTSEVVALLSSGARLSGGTDAHGTPLMHVAVSQPGQLDFALLDVLCNNGLSVEDKDRFGRTARHVYVKRPDLSQLLEGIDLEDSLFAQAIQDGMAAELPTEEQAFAFPEPVPTVAPPSAKSGYDVLALGRKAPAPNAAETATTAATSSRYENVVVASGARYENVTFAGNRSDAVAKEMAAQQELVRQAQERAAKAEVRAAQEIEAQRELVRQAQAQATQEIESHRARLRQVQADQIAAAESHAAMVEMTAKAEAKAAEIRSAGKLAEAKAEAERIKILARAQQEAEAMTSPQLSPTAAAVDVRPTHTAQYAFTAIKDTHLTVAKNELLRVTETSAKGWSWAIKVSHETGELLAAGWVPSNYVKPL